MSDIITDAIESTAIGPASVRTDAGEVTAQDISKMIEADRYIASKNGATSAGANTRPGHRFNRLTPPGTI